MGMNKQLKIFFHNETAFDDRPLYLQRTLETLENCGLLVLLFTLKEEYNFTLTRFGQVYI